MRQQIAEGGYDHLPHERLRADLNTLVRNALLYNVCNSKACFYAKILLITGELLIKKMRPLLASPDVKLMNTDVTQKHHALKKAFYSHLRQHFAEEVLNYNQSRILI